MEEMGVVNALLLISHIMTQSWVKKLEMHFQICQSTKDLLKTCG